jgi:2-methylcitrate dehydratase PrpD
MQPGIAIKQYPCCGSTHPAIDAMLELVRRHDLKADAVERIQSWTHKRRLEHTNRPDPQSTKDAKFSVQYCLARALVDRKVSVEHFEGETYRDPQVRAVMARVQAAPYTTDQFPAENHFGAEVKVTLRGGTVLGTKVDQPAGRTSANPLPPERLKEKFDNCALRVLSADRVAAVYSAIMGFEKLPDVRSVNNAMLADPAEQRHAAGTLTV